MQEGFVRQTSLSIGDLIYEYNHPTNIPQCRIFSEIGVTFVNGGKEASMAEKFLLDHLNDGNWGNSVRALCFLLTPPQSLSPNGKAKVEEFMSHAGNKDAVDRAKCILSACKM